MLRYRSVILDWRRLCFILRLRLQAIITRSTLELNVAKTCTIDKGIKVVLEGAHNKITIGDRALLGERVMIVLRDGELYMGERAEIRAECIARITGGRLYLERAIVVSYRCMFHCGKSIEIGRYTGLGEYVTVMDGEHVHTQSDDYWWLNDPQAKIVLKGLKIGIGAYIGAKTTIVMGADIGDFCRIGANSVVTRKIEPHTLAAGIPAKPIKKLV